MRMLAGLMIVASMGHAQPVVSAKAGLIAYAEGSVLLDGQPVAVSEANFPEMKEGALLQTGPGRAEVLLAPCASLRIAESSSFRMVADAVANSVVQLLSGTAVVDVGEIPPKSQITVRVDSAAVAIRRRGVYRFDVAASELRVQAGAAALERGRENTTVVAGRTISMAGSTPARKTAAPPDSFDEWSRKRSVNEAKASGAARYQRQQAQTLAAAANAAASTEGAPVRDPIYIPRKAPEVPLFASPAQVGAYSLPSCVEPK